MFNLIQTCAWLEIVTLTGKVERQCASSGVGTGTSACQII